MTELEQLIAKFDRDYPDDMRLAREALKTDPLKASDHLVCIDITDALLCHEIIRLRAELAEWKATTPAPKPDCRTCAHVYTDMESYGCKRSTTIIVCIKGDGYVPSLPVRLYETGGE